MTRYAIERLVPSLLEPVAALAQRVRGGTLRDQIAYYRWKYFGNPYIAEPLVWVALHDGQVVGIRGHYGTCWQLGDGSETRVFPAASDSAVLESHRDDSLYRALSDAALQDAAERGFSHVINMSASPKMGLMSVLTLGWRAVVPHEVMALGVEQASAASGRETPTTRLLYNRITARAPAHVRRHARSVVSWIDRSGRLTHNPFLTLDRATRRAPLTAPRLVRSPAELAEVACRLSAPSRLHPVRDEQFYAWRFASPAGSYRCLVVDCRDGHGYLILCQKPNRSPVFVLDWQGSSAEIKLSLLRTARDVGRIGALSMWTASLPVDDVSLLRGEGFTRVKPRDALERKRRALLVRPTRGSADEAVWALAGFRLDRADSWDARATASDSY